MKTKVLKLPLIEIKVFCEKWKIKELSIFGSAIRDDFDFEKSDFDILFEFLPNSEWGWEISKMKEELEFLLGRQIDFVSKKAIEKSQNPYRKKSILSNYKVIYDKVS